MVYKFNLKVFINPKLNLLLLSQNSIPEIERIRLDPRPERWKVFFCTLYQCLNSHEDRYSKGI